MSWVCSSCSSKADISSKDSGDNKQPAGWLGLQVTPKGIPDHDFQGSPRHYLCPHCVSIVFLETDRLRDFQETAEDRALDRSLDEQQ